jgi:hypothetical protein
MQRMQQNEAVEMRSLRPVAVCQRIDQRRNEDISQEQNMFDLCKNELISTKLLGTHRTNAN